MMQCIRNLIVLGSLWVLSAFAMASVDQSSVYSLSLEQNTGYPRFQWKASPGDTEFVVVRYHQGKIATCPGRFEIQEYVYNENITRCVKHLNINSSSADAYSLEYETASGIFRFADRGIVVDDASPDEYKYTVKSANDSDADLAPLWAASCPIVDGQDPLERWVNNFNQRIALGANWLKRSDIPNVSATSGSENTLKVIQVSSGKELILFANSKYVAVFTNRGNLVGLTHRALGEEFMTYQPEFTTQAAVTRDVFSTSNAWN